MKRTGLIVVVLVGMIAQAACGEITVVPADLNNGDPYRLIFVTEGGVSATSTDIGFYNGAVTSQADQSASLAALATNWSAVVSTPTGHARDYTSTIPGSDGVGIPIYNLQGERIANNYADLWDGYLLGDHSTIESGGVRYNQFGIDPGLELVWTGTNQGGFRNNGGLGSTGLITVGHSVQSTSQWIHGQYSTIPTPQYFLYGLSDVLDVPGSAEWEERVVGSYNAVARDYVGNGVFTEIGPPAFGYSLSIRKFDFPVPEGIPRDERSVIEFDVTGMDGSRLWEASFEFEIPSYSSGREPVEIYGYSGNGSMELADATAAGELLGSYIAEDFGLGSHSIPLDAGLLATLLDGSDYVGLRLQGSVSGTNSSVGELGPYSSPEPTIYLTFGPILGDADLDGYVDDDDLSLLLTNWGQVTDWEHGELSGTTPVNDDDLSILLSNWHAGTPPPAPTAIPEPASAALLLLGLVGLLRQRKIR